MPTLQEIADGHAVTITGYENSLIQATEAAIADCVTHGVTQNKINQYENKLAQMKSAITACHNAGKACAEDKGITPNSGGQDKEAEQ